MLELNDLSFSSDELLMLRLLEMAVLSNDFEASTGSGRTLKRTNLKEVVRLTEAFALETGLNDVTDIITQPRARIVPSSDEIEAIAIAHSPRVRESSRELLFLELIAGVKLLKGSAWVARDESLASAGRLLFRPFNVSDATERRRRYSKAVKRLAGEAVSPSLRLGLLGGAVTLSLASGGIATAIGSAIGGAMGFSGAAATSAGLAFLGGGSLAAGGFGMAGGTILVLGATKVGYGGGRYLATRIARKSSEVIVIELAKLDYTCGLYPELTIEAVQNLKELLTDIRLSQDGDAREASKSIRAVEAEIRFLTDARAQRLVRRVAKIAPIPGVHGRIDRLR